RKGPLGGPWLAVADFGVQLTIALGIAVGVATAPVGFHFEFAALLIFIFPLVLRAALLPSTPTRTALVGVVCSVPVLVGGHLLVSRSPPLDSITPAMMTVGM